MTRFLIAAAAVVAFAAPASAKDRVFEHEGVTYSYTTIVKGDATELVRTILAGRNGMPSFKNDLSDEQVAAIVSHIRTSWGNGAAPVTPAFIAEVRRRTNNPQGQTRPNSN